LSGNEQTKALPHDDMVGPGSEPRDYGENWQNLPPGVLWGNGSLPISFALICNPDTEFCMMD